MTTKKYIDKIVANIKELLSKKVYAPPLDTDIVPCPLCAGFSQQGDCGICNNTKKVTYARWKEGRNYLYYGSELTKNKTNSET